jgi:seryl-tRNA synthetase
MVFKMNINKKPEVTYGYYSKLLQKPFDSLNDLTAAEEAYHAEQKEKENATAQKKADAKKVEDTFKALNAARKTYKEDLTQLTKEYSEELDRLKKAYALGKKDIQDTLAAAEDAYAKALKAFTDTYGNFHMTLKDGDFETTISNYVNKNTEKSSDIYNNTDLLKWLFGI